jgi:uncharacterized protein YcnI
MSLLAKIAPALIVAGLAGPAFGHITLETTQSAASSTYKAVMRVGHGCEGGQATIVVRVQIPDGFIAVKPMPKAGWTLATTVGPYDKPYDYYGETLTEGVKEITWSGGSLPDDWYDEFVFRGRFVDLAAGTKVYFPVVQECANGAHRWIEIPAEGQNPDDLPEPAPFVTITE